MMDTKWLKIESAADAERVEEAAAILRRGGLLALPTETVYGLGANGLDERAVRRIFEAKGRPQDNPLILHLPSADWIGRFCADVPPIAYELARRFWPGPLTMILKKRDCVPLQTTGGLDTVGVRCPAHAVTRAIIEAAGVPVAAPSANLSGRPSCTTAEDVREDMQGKIDGIVDGGACAVGVESTIVDLTVEPPRLLRPGGLPLEELRELLPALAVDKAVTGQLAADERPRAPGMKYRHYAPRAPVTVVAGDPRASARYLLTQLGAGDGAIVFSEFARLFPGTETRELGPCADKREQARRVFDALRSFDATRAERIFAQCPDPAGLGLAVANRLKKAAGFRVVDAPDDKRLIGIIGGTGAGKTTLLHALAEKGAYLLDCDAVYHEMLQSDETLRAELAAAFDGVFGADGALDRKKLGETVFGDAEKLAVLDEIVRRNLPRELCRRIAASGARYVGIDAVKLIESGIGALCHTVVAVTAPEETRVRRIMARDGITEAEALRRIRAQQSDAYFAEHGECLFVNDCADTEQAELRAAALLDRVIEALE